MKQYYETLKSCALFEGIGKNEFSQMLKCLDAQTKQYYKDDIILLAGRKITSVGIIVSGIAHVIKEDYSGNRIILEELSTSDIFGEVFAFAKVEHSSVTVLSISDCEVLYIDFKKMTSRCSAVCVFHTKLIENMLKLISIKNLKLNNKIHLLSRRTTREKLLYYFFTQVERSKNSVINIPFNRNELADYICVDRSAMSRELSKMRDEGLIRFHKNRFELLNLSQLKIEVGQS